MERPAASVRRTTKVPREWAPARRHESAGEPGSVDARTVETCLGKPSPRTAVATGIVPSARVARLVPGLLTGRPTCSPSATSTSSSRFVGAIAYHNNAALYDLLFRAASDRTQVIAADPSMSVHRIGITAFLLPARVLSALFRRLFLTRRRALHGAHGLKFFGSNVRDGAN